MASRIQVDKLIEQVKEAEYDWTEFSDSTVALADISKQLTLISLLLKAIWEDCGPEY